MIAREAQLWLNRRISVLNFAAERSMSDFVPALVDPQIACRTADLIETSIFRFAKSLDFMTLIPYGNFSILMLVVGMSLPTA